VSEVARALEAKPLRRFKPYPAYKDSGVECLGEIPTHWGVKRLKTLADVQLSNVDKKSVEGQEPVRLCNYTDVYYNERITTDLEFMTATATREQVLRFALRAGDVLITKDSESWTDIAVPAVVAKDLPDVLCGYHLAHIRPRDGVIGEFLSRAFSAMGPRDQFQMAANGITRFGLGGDVIQTGMFAMPPEPEQCAIAAFLDRETARIDALVAKKERLIALLQEQRTALITRAVTKGLDPTVPMKDSGVEWLGEIPAHWEVKKVKRLCLVRRGASPRPIDDPVYFEDEGEYAWVRIADVTASDRYLETTTQRLSVLGKSKSVPLEPGELFVSIAATVGKPIVTKIKCCIHDGFVYFVGLRENREYLYYLFSCGEAYKGLGKLGTQLNLNTDTIGDICLPRPSPDEQETIVQFLDHATAKIDALVAKVGDAIERLKEFRTALISAAVTGKVDVRGEVA
jgi:type I restriction enzyme S subunit